MKNLSEARSANACPKGRILFIGTAYYNTWYLSRALRGRGWIADTFSDGDDGADNYMHGTDYRLKGVLPSAFTATPAERQLLDQAAKDYLARVPRKRPTQPSVGAAILGKLRAHAARWLGRFDLRPADCAALSFADLFRRLLTETHPPYLLALFEEFLRRVQPQPTEQVRPIYEAARRYDILHFCGVNNLRFLYFLNTPLFGFMPIGWDIDILRRLGKRIVYSNIGCLDGVSQSAFRRWGPYPVCDICKWRDVPSVCSDERNLAWGALRNHLTDFQVNIGGNRADYNDDPRVHEVPQFYCLDPDFWRPDLPIPQPHRLPARPGIVRIYHAVGNYDLRTREGGENIKTTHIIVPAVERLKAAGYPVELVFCKDVPNTEVRYYQAQADIVVDMLTFGFFGANVREALMLGKPSVCFLRPEWLASMRAEVPDYVDELPVVSATPETIQAVLVDLVTHPEKRAELGRRGRAFALKWHSSEVGARRMEQIYLELLQGRRHVPQGRAQGGAGAELRQAS
jgi:glycosyltransferase involved in cell wall biosynthesis